MELHVTPRNPSARWTSQLARRVAYDVAERGWELEAVMSDNGSEFRSPQFRGAVAALGAEHHAFRFSPSRAPERFSSCGTRTIPPTNIADTAAARRILHSHPYSTMKSPNMIAACGSHWKWYTPGSSGAVKVNSWVTGPTSTSVLAISGALPSSPRSKAMLWGMFD